MNRNHLIAIVICVIIIIAAAVGYSLFLKPAPSANPTGSFATASKFYSDSVDLANAGDYTGALQAADKALKQNVSSLMPLIQSNRAGILVMLGRNEEAIAAADAALTVQGNLTTAQSIALFNKGNALHALGRTAEAQAAYTLASGLDPMLPNPYRI